MGCEPIHCCCPSHCLLVATFDGRMVARGSPGRFASSLIPQLDLSALVRRTRVAGRMRITRRWCWGCDLRLRQRTRVDRSAPVLSVRGPRQRGHWRLQEAAVHKLAHARCSRRRAARRAAFALVFFGTPQEAEAPDSRPVLKLAPTDQRRSRHLNLGATSSCHRLLPPIQSGLRYRRPH